MYQSVAKKTKISFFMGMGLVGFFAVFTGFGKTLPPVISNPKTPQLIYIHGAFAFSWICLFFIQATLIRYNNFRLHKVLGFLGIFIAIGAALTMLPAGVYEVQKELNTEGESAYSDIVGVITTSVMFLSIVVTGILNRKTPEMHKRLMLLATIVILWPAWFRLRHYFPSVPRPDIWFGVVLADSLIIIAWVRDKLVNGKIHPILLYVGLFIIAENIFEICTYNTVPWRTFGKHIYELLST